jgi:hypothetical protein
MTADTYAFEEEIPDINLFRPGMTEMGIPLCYTILTPSYQIPRRYQEMLNQVGSGSPVGYGLHEDINDPWR